MRNNAIDETGQKERSKIQQHYLGMKGIHANLFHAFKFMHDLLHGLADVVARHNCVCSSSSTVGLGGHGLCARDEKVHDSSIQSVQVFEVRLSI